MKHIFALALLIATFLVSDGDAMRRNRAAAQFLTGETGHRTGNNQDSQTAGATGPILLQDIYTLEKLRRFNTERIPERVVHARGIGAFGYFRSTKDISSLTRSKIFSGRGKRTGVFCRFSTVAHSKHSPETLRDIRGFSLKFNSRQDGIWDLVGNNLPVFPIRDHIKFPDLVHAIKPDPITNIQDPNRVFDFFAASGGAATHVLTMLFSDLGIPKSYRFMQGNGVHAYKFVNAARKFTYVKFNWVPVQGEFNLTGAEAQTIQATDFNHATRDLIEAIREKNFPRWKFRIQVLKPEQLVGFDFNPLDATKIWPESIAPFMEVGELVLNRIPGNFFQFSEQSAFDPGNFLPAAIEPSEDRLLQGRLISYHESQMYRLGSGNFQQLPVNKPIARINNYNQNGKLSKTHFWSGTVNYEPSFQPGTFREDPDFLYSNLPICGMTQQKPIANPQNFKQAGETYLGFDEAQRANLIQNLGGELSMVRSNRVRNTMCAFFFKANKEYGTRLAPVARCNMNAVRRIARTLE